MCVSRLVWTFQLEPVYYAVALLRLLNKNRFRKVNTILSDTLVVLLIVFGEYVRTGTCQ